MIRYQLSRLLRGRYNFPMIKLLMLFILLTGHVCYSADTQYLEPALFLNDFPEDIHVVQGQPVTIPIFLVTGDYTSVPLEFFVWRHEIDTNKIFCLAASGWQEVNSVEVCQPLAIFQTLPSYYRIAWTAFDGFDSATLDDFNLTLCLDQTINYHPEDSLEDMFCAECKVFIDDPPPAPEVDHTPQAETDDPETSQSAQETPNQPPSEETENVRPSSHVTGPPSFNLFGTTATHSTDSEESWNIYGNTKPHNSSTSKPSSVSASPRELSFYAYIGEETTGIKTIRIKDNCGGAVAAHLDGEPPAGVTVTPSNSTPGLFSVQVSLLGLDGVTDLGNIRIMTESEDHLFSIPVSVTITEVPDVSDDEIPTLEEGYDYYTIEARSFKLFKFLAGGDRVKAIQLSNTPYADQPRTVHLLVKRGAVPTVNEFNETWKIGRANGPNLYYKYNTGSQAEFVEIMDSLDTPQWYYVMLYNNGDRAVRYQRLSFKLIYPLQ